MGTYKLCNNKTGKDVGTFEANSPGEAALMAGCIDDVIVTSVGLPAAPAASAIPFTLPLAVGTAHGYVPDQIYDATGQAVLILYSVDSRGSVEEARKMEHNHKGMERGDYVVKAVNEHEGLVKRVAELEDILARAFKYTFTTKMAGIMDRTLYETLIAKPVDRRKD